MCWNACDRKEDGRRREGNSPIAGIGGLRNSAPIATVVGEFRNVGYWLHRRDEALDSAHLKVTDTRIEGQDIIIVWSQSLGVQGYTKGSIGRMLSAMQMHSFVRLPAPLDLGKLLGRNPDYSQLFDAVGNGQFQYIPDSITTGLMEFIKSDGKFIPHSVYAPKPAVVLDKSVLSDREVLGGIDLPKLPRPLLKLLRRSRAQPTNGARSVVIATTVLAVEYETVPGEFSTIQLLLGLVESANGGADYHLTQPEREALAALAEIITTRPGYQQARARMTDHLHTPPRLADVSQTTIKITSGAEKIITKAALSAQTQGHGAFGADHLVRAFLDSPGVSEQLPKWLNSIELTEETLAAQWGQALEHALHDRPGTYRPLSDHVDGKAEDLLDINGDALTLARFIANRKTTPPIAIALFGEWGQGKSFFAKRIKAHVKTLADQSKALLTDKTDSDDLPYHAHVCQVEFNAWHYMESNLWASLVDHIVTSLDEHMTGQKDQRKELLEQLVQNGTELADAKKEVAEAEKDAEDAEGEVKTLDETVKAQEEERAAINLDSGKLWGNAHGLLMRDGALAAPIDNACKQLGMPEVGKDAETLRSVYVQANGAIAAWRPLKAHFWKIALGAVVIGVLFWKFPIGDWWPWSGLGSTVTAVTAMATAASWWLSRIRAAGRLITNAFTEVESLTRHEQTEAELKLTKIRQQQQATLLRLDAARKRAAACQAALNEAQRKLDALSPDEQMRDFFARRMTDQTYSKHLGLIATIRRDFERMSLLLTEKTDSPKSNLPSLRRIVLYVDDLDRCPPKLVLQVLQAIHLLLAFPLFLVVVAVDVRWLVKTLQKEHPFLANAIDPEKELRDHATAEDYLEKIFQIPYWVRPMGADTAAAYLKALMRSSETENSNPATPEGIPQPPPVDVEDDGNGNGHGGTVVPLGPKAETTPDDSLVPIVHTNEEMDLAGELFPDRGGPPRRSKRFVNLYLLVKLGLSNRQRTNLVANNDYACIMILLALVIAMPRNAAKTLDTLRNADENTTLNKSALPAWEDDIEERKRAESILEIAETLSLPHRKVRQWLPLARRHLFSVTPPPSSPAIL